MSAPSSGPTIHEAKRATDGSGIVHWGRELDYAEAVLARQAGRDVVVRGDDIKATRSLAQGVEAAVGPYWRGPPHKQSAGPHALPHFQQKTPPPEGHSFYETSQRKARK